MKGKSKCKILKEIRRRIARENDIPLITSQCTYQGQCSGTCPKCEQELRYLEQELANRRQMGKLVTVSALALGLVAGSAGCEITSEANTQAALIAEEQTPVAGDIRETEDAKPTQEDSSALLGEVACTEPAEATKGELIVLEGDIAYIEPDTLLGEEEATVGMLPAPSETDGE